MTTLRLAWRLGMSGDIRARWRQVSIIGAAFVVSLVSLLAVGLTHAATASDQRIEARSPTWATSERGAVLRMSARGMTVADLGQVPVVWLEPTAGHEADPAVVPPGLRRLPAPGEGVLSLGLQARGWTAADFGLASSTAGTGVGGAIGAEGLSTPSEGWIYARPAPGRSLGTGGAILFSRGYPEDGKSGISFETIPEIPTRVETTIGVLWLLLIPGAYLIFSAVRAVSSVREARARSLWRLGISSGRIRLLLAMETALLATVGALLAAVVWITGLSHVTKLPLAIVELHPHAIAFPWWEVALTVLLVILAAAGSTTLGRIRGRSHAKDAKVVRGWHAIPLIIALAMMGSGPLLSQSSQGRIYLLFGGLILMFVALPMALPVVVAKMGTQLGRLGNPAVWLAGRRMSLRSANLAKPAAMVGALVFVAGAAFAIYDKLIGYEERPNGPTTFTAFDVNWRDPMPGDLSRVQESAREPLLALPTVETAEGTTAYFQNCPSAARATPGLADSACQSEGAMTAEYAQAFKDVIGMSAAVGRPSTDASGVLILAPVGTTSQQIMKTLTGMPAVNINPMSGYSKTRDPRAAWMLAGWVLATLLLTIALIREIGDRALSSMNDYQQLIRQGLSHREIQRSYRWSLIAPIAVSLPIGFVGAVFFALLGYELGVTLDNLGRIAMVTTIAGLLSTATFALVFRVQRRIVARE